MSRPSSGPPGAWGSVAARTPVPDTGTYHADGIRGSGGGGAVTWSGPAEAIADQDETAPAPAGWTCGPHDTLPLIHPTTVSGFRPIRPEK
ncbi:hypothetical protein ACWEQC_09080 [Streptomyces shenzhenensis]